MAAGRSCRCQCWASILISSWKPIGLEGGTADNEWYPCGFACPGPRHLSHAHTATAAAGHALALPLPSRLGSTRQCPLGIFEARPKGPVEHWLFAHVAMPLNCLSCLCVRVCVCDTRSCCCCCCCVRAMPLTIRPMPNWQTRQSHCYFGGRLLFFRLAWAYCGPRPPAHAHAQRYTTPANCANKRGNERERESSREREGERMPASSTIIRMLHAKLVPQIASISLRVRVVVVAASCCCCCCYCCPVRVVFSARFALDCNNLISSLLFEPNQLPT